MIECIDEMSDMIQRQQEVPQTPVASSSTLPNVEASPSVDISDHLSDDGSEKAWRSHSKPTSGSVTPVPNKATVNSSPSRQ